MPTVPVEAFMSGILGDEGWQSPLSEFSLEAVILELEAIYPPDATLSEAEVAHVRRALRTLAQLVGALNAGNLDEATLVAACLRMLER